jgi:hypothetical protein
LRILRSRPTGLPATGRKARKFLLRPEGVSKAALEAAGIEVKVFTIEKCYPLLPGSGSDGKEETGYTYVRRRSSEEGFASYGETRVEVRDGETIELKRVLKASEYARMVSYADPARHIVRTQRTCTPARGSNPRRAGAPSHGPPPPPPLHREQASTRVRSPCTSSASYRPTRGCRCSTCRRSSRRKRAGRSSCPRCCRVPSRPR